MKRLLTLVAFFATIQASAQQVNPVPDYVFRNQMSVGRGTVTDTAAYFSIGPRYGAVKGFMPPIVVDTATFSSGKRNGLLIFSVQKNKFLYWDSVRVQWSDMAGSSGSYITGTLTNNYIPKATSSTTLGNSIMYDSSGHIRIYGNYVGNTFENRTLFTSEISGYNGYTALFKQSDSISNAGQFPLILRKGLLTTDKPRPNYGVGMETQLQDDAGTWRRSGFVVNRIVDSTAANFRTKFDFRLINGSTYPIPLIVSGDSSIRMAKLAGSGTRYVVADANGDLSATGSTALVDTTTISTRAWRQKGLDSLAALEVSGSGTTNYVPKFTAGGTIGNSQIVDNAASGVSIGGKTLIRDDGPFITGSNISGGANNMAIGTPTSGGFLSAYTNATERLRIFANGRVGINTTTDAGYQLDVNGTLRSVNGANFATTSGNVGVGTASPRSKFELSNVGNTIAHISSFLTGTVAEPILIFLRSNNDNLGTLSATQTGQILGRIAFNGVESGNSSDDAAFIRAVQDGLASSFRVPAYIEFGTGNESENPTGRMRITKDGEVLINTTTDAGDYKLQVSGNIYSTGSYTSGSPSGGTARPWKLGSVVASTVILDTANYVEVEINGVAYKLALATPN